MTWIIAIAVGVAVVGFLISYRFGLPPRWPMDDSDRLGLADPHEGNPGTFCNPNKTPLPPQPNRDKP